MVRTANPHNSSHHQDDEEDDGDELAPGTADASSNRDGKSSDQKPNSSRSKHSETEQRRRSKINERFQILKDLIPPNDQRRDKASLLLEVIEYIQFLHEKIQMFEGSCQGWSQEPTKLMPWSIQRSNHGLGDGYSDHSQVMKNGCAHDNNGIQPMENMQSIIQSDFSGNPYERENHVIEPTSAVPLNMSSLPTIYSGRCILPAENLASQPEFQAWHGESAVNECTTTANTMSMQGRTPESSSTNISDAYSQGLLKNLTKALQTSGVDLSQANISVQLEITKRENSSHTLSASAPETLLPGKGLSGNQMRYREENAEDRSQAAKRFRAGES